jgi:hypothetical protein
LNRRIATIDPETLAKAMFLIREGNGGSTLAFETGLNTKQVNACYQLDFEQDMAEIAAGAQAQ